MNKFHQVIVNTSLIKLRITSDEQQLIRIEFADNKLKLTKKVPLIIENTLSQIEAYFTDHTFRFHLPLAPANTTFQRRVREALLEIPVGSTRSYLQVARSLNTSPRAVGNACRNNPFPFIIPCHRIVATNGIGGFSGETQGKMINLKKQLLKLEQGEFYYANF